MMHSSADSKKGQKKDTANVFNHFRMILVLPARRVQHPSIHSFRRHTHVYTLDPPLPLWSLTIP